MIRRRTKNEPMFVMLQHSSQTKIICCINTAEAFNEPELSFFDVSGGEHDLRRNGAARIAKPARRPARQLWSVARTTGVICLMLQRPANANRSKAQPGANIAEALTNRSPITAEAVPIPTCPATNARKRRR